MQDDLVDAVRWAAGLRLIDPARVCLAGASYGGYATLMGLIRDPEHFRCGVSWLVPTDVELAFSIGNTGFDFRRYGMPVLVGDGDRDAVKFAAASPRKNAERLKQPLLLAYGGVDRHVPIAHGKPLRDALRPHNSRVEWVEYPDEEHGWYLLKNQVDFWILSSDSW